MSDIRTLYTPEKMAFDWAIAGAGLEEDDGLETAVLLSLFTDRRAAEDDPLPGVSDDRRGWWADQYQDVAGDKTGSRLWLIAREKQTASVLVRAQEYAEEALAWLVQDGIARAVTVTAQIVRTGVLGLTVEIARADSPTARYRFETFWKAA